MNTNFMANINKISELNKEYLAPRNTVEIELTKIWSEVLDIRPIGVRDNFFDDLGGHSLLAARLFRKIEKSFGKEISLATLFDSPTVEQLASVLGQERESTPWSSLVAIQTGGDKPPFFGIHGGYDSILIYYNLARYLAPKQPVYGLQPQGMDEEQVPHNRIEDMATAYIREIRTVQPQGPYFLGGFSMGGKVAFEMAQQLRVQGQKVAMLALFDTQAPGWLLPLAVHERVSRHLSNLLGLKPKEKLAYVQKKLTRRLYSDTIQPLPKVQHKSALREAHEQADKDYVPQVYPGEAILFRAQEQPLEWFEEEWLQWWGIDPQLGWGSLVTGGLEIQEVPGHHMNMFKEPYLRVLAEKLQACLDRAQANLANN
jgi:thioesterase domain-containing protein/acyl carrier protein